METLAGKLSFKTLNSIVDKLQLVEVTSADGGPFMSLVAEKFGNLPVGCMRLWDGGDSLLKLVYTGISVEPIGIDSHMLFAFTQPDSLVPTFTLDSVYTRMPPGADANFPEGGDMYSFHLDLVPKCDLAVNQPMIQRAYEPLTGPQRATLEADGIFPAMLSPTQRAIMSPWMLAQRVAADAYDPTVFDAADTYLQHWFALLDDGLESLRDSVEDQQNPVVELGLSIASFTYGSLLGAFLLGIMVDRVRESDAMVGFIVFIMFAWPFIDERIRKHTKFQEASVVVGIFGALMIIGMTVWEAYVAH